MATGFNLGGFDDLRAAEAASLQPLPDLNPLEALIGGFQQGAAIRNLPQTMANKALNDQLALAVQQAKLRDLQQGEITKFGNSIGRFNPVTQKWETLATAPQSPEDALRAQMLQLQIQKLQQPQIKNIETSSEIINVDEAGKEISRIPIKPTSKAKVREGFDTKTQTFGDYAIEPGESLPEGVVPADQVSLGTTPEGKISGTLKGDKPKANKAIPNDQINQLTGINLLTSRLDTIANTPENVRATNVGWMDNILGGIQSATGLGKKSAIDQNETFRTAVDSLVAEFSFGRGGKALTVTERDILGKYLPLLTNSNGAFESRLRGFKNLVNEFKNARLQALELGGYDISNIDKVTGVERAAPQSQVSTSEVKALPIIEIKPSTRR